LAGGGAAAPAIGEQENDKVAVGLGTRPLFTDTLPEVMYIYIAWSKFLHGSVKVFELFFISISSHL
jgi:hypothetical protein